VVQSGPWSPITTTTTSIATTNCDCGLDCDTTPECHLQLECSVPPLHTTPRPPTNNMVRSTRYHEQGRGPRAGGWGQGLQSTRRKALVNELLIWGSAFPTRRPLANWSTRQRESHMPPHLSFPPERWHPRIGPSQRYCGNYLLDFLLVYYVYL
jgi:hypothetical protein